MIYIKTSFKMTLCTCMHDKNIYVWNDAILSYVFGVYIGHIANIGFVKGPKNYF